MTPLLGLVQSAPHSSFRVAYPFDGSNGTRPDIILRSADGVDFRVMKGILAVASPVFQDMATLAEPLTRPLALTSIEKSSASSEEMSEDGLPVVVMYESNAIVLDTLLRIIYPVVPPKLDELDLDLLSDVLHAAQKYDMESVLHIIEETLRAAAVATTASRKSYPGDDEQHQNQNQNQHQRLHQLHSPMAIYVLACECRLEDLARLAVHEFLKYPDPPGYFKGLEKSSGAVVFHLFDYRRRVADAVDTLFAPLRKTNVARKQFGSALSREVECFTRNVKSFEGCGTRENGCYISSWWVSVRESVRGEIQKAPLAEDVVTIELIAEAASSSRSRCCSNCKEKVLGQLPMLEASIKKEMRRLATEVKFELPW